MSKEKSPQEKAAVEREKELLAGALNGAAASGGYWLKVSARTAPRFYPKGPDVSPFNALILGMHADRGGYKTARYFSFNEAKKYGEAVLQGDNLFMDIDGVPCSVLLPHNAAEACREGALPINTLANAVLAKHEETRLLAQENYRNSERVLEEGRERALGIK